MIMAYAVVEEAFTPPTRSLMDTYFGKLMDRTTVDSVDLRMFVVTGRVTLTMVVNRGKGLLERGGGEHASNSGRKIE